MLINLFFLIASVSASLFLRGARNLRVAANRSLVRPLSSVGTPSPPVDALAARYDDLFETLQHLDEFYKLGRHVKIEDAFVAEIIKKNFEKVGEPLIKLASSIPDFDKTIPAVILESIESMTDRPSVVEYEPSMEPPFQEHMNELHLFDPNLKISNSLDFHSLSGVCTTPFATTALSKFYFAEDCDPFGESYSYVLVIRRPTGLHEYRTLFKFVKKAYDAFGASRNPIGQLSRALWLAVNGFENHSRDNIIKAPTDLDLTAFMNTKAAISVSHESFMNLARMSREDQHKFHEMANRFENDPKTPWIPVCFNRYL